MIKLECNKSFFSHIRSLNRLRVIESFTAFTINSLVQKFNTTVYICNIFIYFIFQFFGIYYIEVTLRKVLTWSLN